MTSISILRNTAALIATNTRQPWLVPQGKVSWMSFCSTSSVWVTAGLKPRNAYNQHQKPSKRLRTIVESNDLPQGLLVSPQVQYDGEEGDPQYPTVIQQVRNHMRKYDDCVVLTRVGNFYELYFEHAEEYGPLLNLKVARRKTNAGDVPMSGFQYQYLVKYLRILVMDLRKHVAISEEFPNSPADSAKSGGLTFDRKVDRVVTAGTLIDEDFLDPDKNNYLLSIHLDGNRTSQQLGLAWLDLSSSTFFVNSIDATSLASALARISPSEVVLDGSFEKIAEDFPVVAALKEAHCSITWHQIPEGEASLSTCSKLLERPLGEAEMQNFSPEENGAAGLILHYVQDRLQNSDVKFPPPARQSEYLSIDRYSINALEIKTTLRDGLFKGSLLHVLQNTVTRSGSRLLATRLLWPSLDLAVINGRLDLVETFTNDTPLRIAVQKLLQRTFDTSRLLTKFSLGRADADDLLGLSKTINITTDLCQCIKNTQLKAGNRDRVESTKVKTAIFGLLERISLDGPMLLASRIADAIDEEGLSEQQFRETSESDTIVPQESRSTPSMKSSGTICDSKLAQVHNATSSYYQTDIFNEPWIMKRDASTRLKELHKSLDELRIEQNDLVGELRRKMGAPSVTLKMTPGMGHFCHLKHKTANKLIDQLDGAKSISSSKSTASFQYPAWTQLGEHMERVRMRIRVEEQKVFSRLCEKVGSQLDTLRRNASVLDELDVACSYATVASKRNWVRPILNNSTSQIIIGGKHPMVDLGLAEKGVGFTTNDCQMNPQERLLFITGPNMAGKSTYLRQNALITILAQTGSFVPAIHAEMGLVDKVFSRVGSADNLSRDQSTFMVEMLESAEILKNATERSFVIMDEVGRGTTPEDGIALGFACLDHLARVNKCRALFATHFHLLADLTKDFGNVGYYCTDVVEDETGFSYIHRLRPGVNRESHALKVARLAGLPNEAVKVAAKVLQQLNSGKASTLVSPQDSSHGNSFLNQDIDIHSVNAAG